MKLLFVFLSLSLCFNICYGQSKELISIPVLKESKTIDNLMGIILNPKNIHKYDRDKTSTDSCFFLFISKSENHASFEVEKKTKVVSNTIANRCIQSRNFGCFLYRKYKIFVFSIEDIHDFFDITDGRRTFDFVYKIKNSEFVNVEDYLAIWHYQYENGKISEEGPPPVKELEKN